MEIDIFSDKPSRSTVPNNPKKEYGNYNVKIFVSFYLGLYGLEP